ncbi:uncharacterized protein LOC117170737 [Belonocnema kinseyi]|uniref:uncharacterized protein LOC117170737 n=1 Tax=Belonocnema kinseyi TaxID=2817044 RepID=UPI00143D6A27|nr:uncharacterized protein LOC117170737 [Belonocnema kinseyi]
MIKKPNGKYRFCLDFRKVNNVTKKDLYPVPIMAEILDTLRSTKYIFKIDQHSAYNQIPLESNSREITAFMVPGKGFVVNGRGLQIDEDKIKPILDFPRPKTVKQLQLLIEMASWYRRLMPHFSEIIDFRQPFQLETDASDINLGAVLTQIIEGNQIVIAYASRRLNEAEQKKFSI